MILWARVFGLAMYAVLVVGYLDSNYDLIAFFAVVSWVLCVIGGFSALCVSLLCVKYDENPSDELALKGLSSQSNGLGFYDWLASLPMVITSTLLLAISGFAVTSAVYLLVNLFCMIVKHQANKRYKLINS